MVTLPLVFATVSCGTALGSNVPPPPASAVTTTAATTDAVPPATIPALSVAPAPSPVLVTPQPALHVLQVGALRQTKKEIVAYRRLAGHWQDLMGLHRSRFSAGALRTHSLPYANWVLKLQKQRTKRLHAKARRWMVRQTNAYVAQIRTWSKLLGMSWYDRQLFGKSNIEDRYNKILKAYANFEKRFNASFLINSFSCIHRYEGAWNADTGNGYYGGLQMDLPFQSRYGGEFLRRWGTADNWPVWAQIQAAVRAYRSGRGFGPWPNTARYCSLL